MSDLFDYVLWRGDIDFSSSAFNCVDALIFSQISYMNFDGLIPESLDETITISELSKRFGESLDNEKRRNLGLVINPETNRLFEKIAGSERFGSIRVCGWKNRYCEKKEEQFLAYTVFIEDFVLVVFRGTDDTIIGWKEDFNLAFEDAIQAQKDALEYLNRVLEKHPELSVRVCGHSKGGNLAIYSSAKANDGERILEVFNFDGPGFSKSDLESDGFKAIRPRIKSFYPECSMIGMLFEHFPEYTIVQSTEELLMQHDAMSWQVLPKQFCQAEAFDRKSVFVEKTFNSWYMELSREQRIQFVESIFEVLSASSAKNFSEFAENWKETFHAVIKTAWEQDFEIKKANMKIVGQLLDAARKNLDAALHSKDEPKKLS